ncbi:MAG: hypothetical protein A2066_05675 [Bacteroidetes bacterium GWB2_41_8]|nr:MAG: hypothetical protein A2066_05675 [Bacteroidetes bacterium GWB2_41_8]
MDKTKINKGRMYHSSNLVLDKFSSTFTDHVELNQAHSELKSGISLIDEQQQVQVVDNKGLTQVKVALRTDVTQRILMFSKALKALATIQKNADLLTKSNYKLSDLNRLSDPILFDVGTMLVKLANPLRSQLEKFFLTDEDYKQTDAILAEFKAAIPQKRLATTVSKSSTKKISDVFKSIDKLLKEVIDVYVAPFEYKNPDFYREYTNARIIVGYTGRGKSKTETKVPVE